MTVENMNLPLLPRIILASTRPQNRLLVLVLSVVLTTTENYTISRQSRVRRTKYLPNSASFDVLAKLQSVCDVGGEDASCEAVVAVVGTVHHFLQSLKLQDALHRPKDLAIERSHSNFFISFVWAQFR